MVQVVFHFDTAVAGRVLAEAGDAEKGHSHLGGARMMHKSDSVAFGVVEVVEADHLG